MSSGSVKATWLNQPWIAPKLVPGATILMTGSLGKRGFTVAEYEFVGARPSTPRDEGGLRAGQTVVLGPLTPRRRRTETTLSPCTGRAES